MDNNERARFARLRRRLLIAENQTAKRRNTNISQFVATITPTTTLEDTRREFADNQNSMDIASERTLPIPTPRAASIISRSIVNNDGNVVTATQVSNSHAILNRNNYCGYSASTFRNAIREVMLAIHQVN